MQIIMTARHFTLNDNLKDAVRTRINKIENQFEILSRADVILTWEKSRFHVNLKVRWYQATFPRNDGRLRFTPSH